MSELFTTYRDEARPAAISATGIFVSIVSIFVSLLNIFSGD